MENNTINKDAEEIAKALKLAIAQIDMSMRESGDSVEKLIMSITNMTRSLRQISNSIETQDNDSDCTASKDIKEQTILAEKYMQEAVTAFQFYDRLSQRFSHIEENLKAIADLMTKPDQQHPELWIRLEKKLRSVYSTEQEQTMYLALLHGISETEVETQPILSNSSQETGEIELF